MWKLHRLVPCLITIIGWYVCRKSCFMCSGCRCSRSYAGRKGSQQRKGTVCKVAIIGHLSTLLYLSCRSAELFSSLNSLAKDPAISPYIVDVRGRGLMIGVEFASATFPVSPANAPPPIAKVASLVAQKCLEKGLLILTTSIYEVIRFIPTLNSTAEEIKEGCKIFADAVKEVIAENSK